MWKLVDDGRPILWLRISSKEQRVFSFILDGIGPGGVENIDRIDEFQIPLNTQRQLGDLLNRLIRDPQGVVDTEGF